MMNCNNTEHHRTATVELLIPNPAIIYTGMQLQDWKKHFIQKKNAASTSTDANLYNRFVKLLLWAEFCNATVCYAGNAKDKDGNLTFKFTFSFPDDDSQLLFQTDWASNIKLVAKV